MITVDRSKLLLAAGCTAFLAAACQSIATAQPAVPAPVAVAPTYKNLQVLPADITKDQLGKTMKSFAQSLGVRCSHCHVGVEGQPLSTFDFASDANPNKDIARAMMRLVHMLNTEQLPAITGLKDAKVTCFTCHRGAKEPATEITPPPAA